MGLSPQLQALHERTSRRLARIAQEMPSQYKLTLICRHAAMPDAEIIVSEDNLSLALGQIVRHLRRDARHGRIPERDVLTVEHLAALGADRVADLCVLRGGGLDKDVVAEISAVAAAFIERCITTLTGPIGAEEMAERGLNERMLDILEALIGKDIDVGSPARKRLELTREELAALGYGPPCPCGERGLLRGERLVETPDGEVCADCAKAEAGDV